jgi:2-phosphoglycolate phosphatase
MSSLPGDQYRAVLFDLDGTLVDTAPDMVGALQKLQLRNDIEPISYALGRANVSNGAMGLLRAGFPHLDTSRQQDLVCEYIELYKQGLCVHTALFEGMAELLHKLEDADYPWGVVTNKPSHLTEPLLELLALSERSACIISGDTLSVRKPDPGQVLHACEIIGVSPELVLCVGDAPRDIEAGRAAGSTTVAAAYGYILADDDPADWGADAIARDVDELTKIVLKGVNLKL